MALASNENCFGHLNVFLENCQGIADLSVWHQTPNTEGLFQNPKCYNQLLQGDWVCQGTKYNSIHPRVTAPASEIDAHVYTN
jgi:hypothetical protein